MDEADEPRKSALTQACAGAMLADPMGGRVHVRWDDTAQATPHGQIVFFAERLATAGAFDRWVQACPLSYSSPNAWRPRDVLGTLMLGMLSAAKRYAHIAGLRGDAVAARALGLRGMVSEDAVRRALAAIAPEAGEPWMRSALMASVREALDRPWVLDLDATIKPLYGRQQGARIGYNPRKPGQPSHVLHTFWVGNLRLVLDAVLSPGKQHTSGHAKAALARLLDELGEQAPALVRGHGGYGNEDIIDVCEQRGLRYLLRLRKTAHMKRLIEPLFGRQDWTAATEASGGWQASEGELRLSGWSKARRVVVLRWRLRHDVALTAARRGRGHDEQFAARPGAGQRPAVGVHGAGDQRAVRAGGRGPALPQPLRLRKRLRRAEEPVGLGRLHHPGHAPQPGQCPGGGAGRQLVELVRARGQPASPARGAGQPAGCCWRRWAALPAAATRRGCA